MTCGYQPTKQSNILTYPHQLLDSTIKKVKLPPLEQEVESKEDIGINLKKMKQKKTTNNKKSSRLNQQSLPKTPEKHFLYARVSTRNQRPALLRQVEALKKYAEYRNIGSYEVIADIGSGINFKRKGLKTLLDSAERGIVKEIVVTHKDRLARFAYDLLEDIFERWKTKIDIIDKENETRSSEEELADDLLTIVHVFSARANGKKRYNKNYENQIETTETNEENIENVV